MTVLTWVVLGNRKEKAEEPDKKAEANCSSGAPVCFGVQKAKGETQAHPKKKKRNKKTNEWRWKKGNAREGYISLQWTPYQFKVFCSTSPRHLQTWKIAFVHHFSLSFFLSSCLSIFFAAISFPSVYLSSFCSIFVKWCLGKKIRLGLHSLVFMQHYSHGNMTHFYTATEQL